MSTARYLLERKGLQDGYALRQLTCDTPMAQCLSLTQTAQACGVLLPSFAVLSGRTQPGICVMAIAADGSVAGCAAAASFLHSDHPQSKRECWWGMLAVHPDHRGKAISLILGAVAIVRMFDTYGFTEFFTGVEPGNRPSEAICSKMGLAHNGHSILGMADPKLLGSGRMTK